MVGVSHSMRRVFEKIRLVAPTRSTVLVTGESGTGKELVVRVLHRLSPRQSKPLVALNCAAIPRDLAESELFGHIAAAFTAAQRKRIGKMLAADSGTLFIDEIGEMDPLVQAKLLRALENRTITPVGADEERPIDVRIVAATHRDLRILTNEGSFRDDLYYRPIGQMVIVDRLANERRGGDSPPYVTTSYLRLILANTPGGTRPRNDVILVTSEKITPALI